MFARSIWISSAAVFALSACGQPAEVVQPPPAPTPQVSQVATADDGALMTLDGAVVSAAPSEFTLDYGAGSILVEMDDWDWYQEGRAIKAGDKVTVTGRFDQDIGEAPKVEASSVYVENLGTVFYASSQDDETPDVARSVLTQPRNIDVTGKVLNIEGRRFTLSGADQAFRVDTSQMAENPLDDEGILRIKPGDRVYVWGDLQLAAADTSLMAQGLINLATDKRTGGPAPSSEAVRSTPSTVN